MGILLGTFILLCGIAAGLIIGRLFCKQHHKSGANNYQTGREEGCSPGCCDKN